MYTEPSINTSEYTITYYRASGGDGINGKGWNSQAHREFPGSLDSSDVSRDNVSREIGRSAVPREETELA